MLTLSKKDIQKINGKEFKPKKNSDQDNHFSGKFKQKRVKKGNKKSGKRH